MIILNYFQCITVQQSSPILFDILFILVFLTYMTANFYVYCYLAEKLQSEVRLILLNKEF